MVMNSALPCDTAEVEQYSSKFEDHELRKILYKIASLQRSNGEIRDSIKIVLLGWNWRAYNNTDLTNSDLNDQIEEFIRTNQKLLDYLAGAGHTLETVDFSKSVDGSSVGEHVLVGFSKLYEMEAIGSTGASKAFHMLYPPVFMMWDRAIIERYHRRGESSHQEAGTGKGKHAKGQGECYLEFLKETQHFVQTKLNMAVFPNKTPAKVMDEYNYAKYTL